MVAAAGIFGKVDELEYSRDGDAWTSDGHRTYTRRFLVEILDDGLTTNKYYGATHVCQAPGLPLVGAPYITTGESDLAAVAVRFRAERVDPTVPYWWIVTVEYSTQMPEGGPTVEGDGNPDELGSVANNPENRPWHIEWDSKIVMRTPQTDLNGMPFVNSAGQPFSPPYQQEEARAVLHIAHNLRTFDRETVTTYSFATNSDDFLGCPAGTVLCHPPRAVLQWYGTISYFRVRWMLEFAGPLPYDLDGTTWNLYLLGLIDSYPGFPESYDELDSFSDVYILNQGLCRKQTNPLSPHYNRPTPIYRMGQQISQPDLLDLDGQPVEPDVTGYRQPTYRYFRVRRQVPFTPIFTSGLGGLV